MPYVVVGLGNPGMEFDKTRHNTGRMIVSWLADSWGEEFRTSKPAKAEVAKGSIDGESAIFLLPNTFMNKSGSSVVHVVRSVKAAEKMVVVYDDLDLPLGVIKVSFDRGSGGHKGIESVMRAVKTKKFLRIRVGISGATPKGKLKKPLGESKVEKHILGKFTPNEITVLKKLTKKIEETLLAWVDGGEEAAMQLGNTR